MVKHIVFWKLKPVALGRDKEANAAELKKRVEALRGRIYGLLHIEVGIDFCRGDVSADVALYAEFENKEALDRYQVHPEHVAIKSFVNFIRQDRMVVDYEV